MKRFLMIILFVACVGSSDDKPAIKDIKEKEQVPPVVQNDKTQVFLSPEEAEILKPFIDDIRLGIRPWDDKSIGICKGQTRTCEEFLGLDAGELPPGKYMVRAELIAPKISGPDKWKVDFKTECEITRSTNSGESSNKTIYEKTYTISHSSKNHGYRLSPMKNIESPSRFGSQKCTWQLSARNLGEDVVYKGSWSVPAAEKNKKQPAPEKQ